jgi:hypothetical protein
VNEAVGSAEASVLGLAPCGRHGARRRVRSTRASNSAIGMAVKATLNGRNIRLE